MRGPHLAALVQGGNFSAEAVALFSRMTTAPTPGRKSQIDTLIRALKAADIWSRLDALYVMAAADSQAARLNWVANQYNLNAVNAPTFTTDRGYTGDGVSAFLNTGVAANTLAKLSQNSVHAAVWNLINVQSFGELSNSGTAALIVTCRDASNRLRIRANSGTTTDYSTTEARGMSALDRSVSTAQVTYRNGVSVLSAAATSAAVTSDNIYLLGATAAKSISQLSFASFGSSLSAAQHLALYNAINAYLQAVGAA